MQRATFNCTIPVVMEFKSTPEISCESGCRKMPWQRLELYAGKLARTVLRGLGAGNRAWLPGDVRSHARGDSASDDPGTQTGIAALRAAVEIRRNSSTGCACMVRAQWLALAPYASILPLRSVKGPLRSRLRLPLTPATALPHRSRPKDLADDS